MLTPGPCRMQLLLLSQTRLRLHADALGRKFIGLSSDILKILQVRRRIRYLEELQDKYDELNDQFEEEMQALQKKYRALYGE